MARISFSSEQAMYEPVANYWRQNGYQVKAEIHHCDLVALRDPEEPVLIELKRSFSMALLVQAAERRQISTRVYIAVPAPLQHKRVTDMRIVCKTMRIGLLFVTKEEVWEVIAPDGTQAARRNQARKKLEKEFNARKTNQNVGGSSRTKLMTSYREDAIQCAIVLINATDDGMLAAEVRSISGVTRCADILRNNVYKWFEQIPKNRSSNNSTRFYRYRIREKKRQEIEDWISRLKQT